MSISIQLDDDRKRFAPGDTISGEIRWSDLTPDTKTVITLDLAFHTEGKGTEQREVHHHLEWPIVSTAETHEFSFDGPTWPWSFSGKLISLVWSLDAWEGKKHAVALPLTVAPNGEEISLYRYVIDEKKNKGLAEILNHKLT